jgi:hypothetical protein
MTKRTKRTEGPLQKRLQRIALAMLALYRRTGGRGPEWRKALRTFPDGQVWLRIFAYGIRTAEKSA